MKMPFVDTYNVRNHLFMVIVFHLIFFCFYLHLSFYSYLYKQNGMLSVQNENVARDQKRKRTKKTVHWHGRTYRSRRESSEYILSLSLYLGQAVYQFNLFQFHHGICFHFIPLNLQNMMCSFHILLSLYILDVTAVALFFCFHVPIGRLIAQLCTQIAICVHWPGRSVASQAHKYLIVRAWPSRMKHKRRNKSLVKWFYTFFLHISDSGKQKNGC